MAGPDRLTIGGFLARLAFALLVVGATYNPTRYSYYAWARDTGWQWRPPIVLVGVVLLIGWVVCLRLTLRSMGGIGLLLANAFLAALFWLLAPTGAGCPSRTSPPSPGSVWSASRRSWPSGCRGRTSAAATPRPR